MNKEILVSHLRLSWEQCCLEIEVDANGKPLLTNEEIFNLADQTDAWDVFTERTEDESWELLNDEQL